MGGALGEKNWREKEFSLQTSLIFFCELARGEGGERSLLGDGSAVGSRPESISTPDTTRSLHWKNYYIINQ